VLAPQHALELRRVDLALDGLEPTRRLEARVVVLFLAGELDQDLQVLESRVQAVVALQLALDDALAAQRALGPLPVVPERRIRGLILQLRRSRTQAVEVKDAPGAR
jgi:hypothetical protein